MQAVMIPLVKSKSGNLSDVNNYRAITISTCLSILIESVIAKEVFRSDDCDKYQKEIKYVFASFVDFSKAFDSINYWKLFNKLTDNKIDIQIVKY